MSPETTERPIEILLVEDNPGDVRLTQEALKQGKIRNHVNLPKKDGREVLSEIKEDPNLRRIPVVVLTSSKAEEDIVKSYDCHANCYITKPVELNQFLNVAKSIEDFWLSIVKLPPRE